MELIKDTIRTCEITAKGSMQTMAEGDVIVPDTKPDILKLLQVDADASITDKYIENGRLIMNGRVDYKILYVPDSENETIKSIITSMEFHQAADSGGGEADCDIYIKPDVERVEFNTVNSRKLRIRAVVRMDYEISHVKSTEICVDADGDDAEKQYCDISFEEVLDVSEHEFTIRESLEIPTGGEPVKEVIKTDVKLADIEYKPVSGKVILKGNMEVCVLYTDCDSAIRFIESEVPFTEVLDAEGTNENAICDIECCILSTMCSPEPDTDGDLRIFMLDVDVSVFSKCTQICTKKMLADCFVPYAETKCTSTEIVLHSVKERPTLRNSIREVIEFPPTSPEASGIYNVVANAIINKSEKQRNKLICEGKVEVYILYLTTSDENPISSLKKEIPFSYMIECEHDTESLDCGIKINIKHISYNLNSNGAIEIRCVLLADCVLTGEERLSNITDAEITDTEKNSGIVIYFANEGERVWDIAKRYKVPVQSLNEHNEIENEILDSNMRLFIPNR